MMAADHPRRPRAALPSWALSSALLATCFGCLEGEGFKASDFTSDDAPAQPGAPRTGAPPAVAPLTPSPSPPVLTPVAPANVPGGTSGASEVPAVPPITQPPGEAASGGEASGTNQQLCRLSGSQVGVIGDSYVDLTTFTPRLQELARAAGALGASVSYVDHALSGASMNGTPNIPSQWPDALADARARGADGIKLVIMTGGGNDILLANRQCLSFASVDTIDAGCKAVVARALDAGRELFQQLVSDGVEAVVYFFYPHLPRFSLLGGPSPNTMLDYALPLVREACESVEGIPCYFVDLGPSFDDGSGFARPELISIDGIHPTDAGAALMAEAVWRAMQDHCLASE
jgi:lysophospholipase L1-like esterase